MLSPAIPISVTTDFLAGGGEMGERIRAYNWENTPLGNPDSWPQSIKTCVRIILTSSQPMFVWCGKDLINLYNDAYKTIVGGKHPEALGQPAYTVWKEIWAEIEPRVEMVYRNIGTYDEALLLIMERNGYPEETYYTFSYSPITGENGAVDGIICANTDSTERIISERQLRTLRDLGKNLQGSLSIQDVYKKTIDVITENPQDFPFAFVYELENEGTRARLSSKTANLQDERITPQVIEIDDKAPWSFDTVAKTMSAPLTHDLHRYNNLPSGPWQLPPSNALILPIVKAGQQSPYGIMVVGLNPYRLPDEKYRSFFQLLADQVAANIATVLTLQEERKRAEALAEIDKAKTTFFSNISHEFRTPLTLMLGPLEDLLHQENGLFSEQHKNTLATTHRNAVRLLRLVNALLDFSRIESGRIHASYQRTDIAAFTKDLASNFRSIMNKAGLGYEVDCEPIDKPVYVDKEMWEKIVLNLLSNAFKYTLKGKVTLSLIEEGDCIRLTVMDTGVGIPEYELPRMFERFHRIQNAGGRSYEGTGIGLSLVHELVQLHKGTISVASKEGEGSEFTVTIPTGKTHLNPAQVSEQEKGISGNFAPAYIQEALSLAEDIAPASKEYSSLTDDNEAKQKTRILIVDDNPDMRAYLSGLLSKQYATETAVNGQQALAKIKTALPDIVISDIMMPVMDGVSMLKSIKSNPITRALPVILLSARAGEDEKIEGYELGADDYLVKPFSAKELLARIQSQLKISIIRKEVEETEIRFHLALDAAQMGAWHYDYSTGAVNRNRHYARILGYDTYTDNWTFDDFMQHVHPEDMAMLTEQRTGSRRNGFFECDFRIIRTDAATRWVRVHGKIFFDENKQPVRSVGTLIDITEERSKNEILQQSEQRLRDLIQQAPVSIAILRVPGYRYEIANEDYFKIAGRHKEEVIGKTLDEIFPELASQGIKQILDQVVATGKPFIGNEYPIVLSRFGRKESVYFNFVYQPLHQADGTINSVMVVATDVTEQVFTKKNIIEAEESSRLAIEAANLGTYTIDIPSGKVTCTERFLEMFGYKKTDEINYTDLQASLHPDFQEIRDKAHQEARQTGLLGYEAKFNGHDHKTRWLRISGRISYDEDKKPVRIIGISMDITEQHELQQRKDDFIRMASHELKTPVTSIKGYVQLLLSMLDKKIGDRPMPVEMIQSSLLTVDKQVTKLTRLMSELLDLSRIESGKLDLHKESLSINELVIDVVQDIRSTNTRFHIGVKHDFHCMINGDRDRLSQVFINIINNAIKYSPDSDRIDILIYKDSNNRVAISIKDYGIGIAPANHERIFERFFRAEGKNEQTYPGFGIGLAIAKDIIERHYGTIWVKSEKDRGSEFVIQLPMCNTQENIPMAAITAIAP